jgi:hypothetical protein
MTRPDDRSLCGQSREEKWAEENRVGANGDDSHFPSSDHDHRYWWVQTRSCSCTHPGADIFNYGDTRGGALLFSLLEPQSGRSPPTNLETFIVLEDIESGTNTKGIVVFPAEWFKNGLPHPSSCAQDPGGEVAPSGEA